MSSGCKLICLGTGDGWPDPRRGHSAYLYQFGNRSVLIDAGDPVERAWTSALLDWNSPDALILSHLHSDHLGGLFMLLQGCWLKGRRKKLPVYLPGGAVAPLRALLEHVYFFPELLPFRLELNPVSDRMVAGGTRISAFRNSHLERLRARFEASHPVDYSSFSFVLSSAGKRVAHSADIGKPEDLAPLLEKPVDLLVCELAHFAPVDLFRFLRGRSIGQLVLTHLSAENRSQLTALKRHLRQSLPGLPCRFVADGEQVAF